MIPGDEILLEIESVALSGEGIARKDGLVFFVEGALRGEQVRAKVVKPESNLVRAAALEVLRISPDRITPVCGYFGRCGGCSFQHLRYERQLEEKREALAGLFRHLGNFNHVDIKPVIPSPNPFHYRNTVAMTICHQGDEPYLGFIGQDSRSFIPIENCSIADEQLNTMLPVVIRKFKDEVPKKIRRRTSQMTIRTGTDGGVYTSVGNAPARPLKATIGEKTFQYSAASFFQVNFSILPFLLETVKRYLNPPAAGTERERTLLFDFYCGVGLFAVSFAAGYEQVVGIEDGNDAVTFARKNAEANHVRNVEFIEGKAETVIEMNNRILPSLRNHSCDVIVDPPRIGMCREAINALLKIENINRLIYVSCHPATLIRDLKLLAGRFRIKEVQPLDIFPQTKHLETVVLLIPNGR